MTRGEAVNWLINIASDIGKAEHRELWHYEQALSEIIELLESQPEVIACGSGELIVETTDDLISKQAAIDAILDLTGFASVISLFEDVEEHDLQDKRSGGIIDAIDAVMLLPSAQPKIIRCKDCMWYNGEINQCNAQICASMCGEDFCSRAERQKE